MSKGDTWALRSSDRLDRAYAGQPEFANLENNAIFRVLIHQHHRASSQRKTMLAGYLLGSLVLGFFYCHRLLGLPLNLSLGYGAAFALTIGIILGVLYIQGGIEGYETNARLKPFFLDIISAGIGPEEIARGIWGKTVAHYRRWPLKFALAVGAAADFSLVLYLDRWSGPVLLTWVAMMGCFGAAHLYRIASYLGYATLPGSILWYRGVRRAYERRLAEQHGRERSFLASLFRSLLFLGASFLAVAIPLSGYLYVGWLFSNALAQYWSPQQRIYRSMHWAAAFAAFLVLGNFTGLICGQLSKDFSHRLFARFVNELRILFETRGQVLSGG